MSVSNHDCSPPQGWGVEDGASEGSPAVLEDATESAMNSCLIPGYYGCWTNTSEVVVV